MSDYAAQKKELTDLAAAVLNLTKEIRALKEAKRNGTSDKENNAPASPVNRQKRGRRGERKTYEGEWKDGLEYDVAWPKSKKTWYFDEFRKKDHAGWKKWRAISLKAQLKALE